MKIKCVNISNENDTINSTFKLNLAKIEKIINLDKHKNKQEPINLFKEGDNVEHKLEGIWGTITFICDDYTSIKWEDNSKEKFTNEEMKKYIIPSTKKIIEEELIEEDLEEEKIDIEKIHLQRKVDEMEKKSKFQLEKLL